MDPVDFIYAKARLVWNIALQYFDNQALILVMALAIIITSLALINRKE